MKFSVFLLISLALIKYSYAQDCAVLSASNNILYYGYPNLVKVFVEKKGCDELTLSTKNKKVRILREKECLFTVEVDSFTENVILEVRHLGETNKDLKQFLFKVREVPMPELTLFSYKNGQSVKLDSFKVVNTPSLKWDFHLHCNILSFKACIIRNNTWIDSVNCNAGITDTKFIANLRKGDTLLLYDIMVRIESIKRIIAPCQFVIE